jgi:hypothetical protein
MEDASAVEIRSIDAGGADKSGRNSADLLGSDTALFCHASRE